MTKTVLITGASSGIGRATARAVVQAGGKAILFARSADKIEALAQELGTGSAVAVAGDVTRRGDLDHAVKAGVERLGGLDAAFVNAGVFFQGALADGDPEQWAEMLDINVMGALRTIRAVLPHMLEREAGDVLLTGSIAGRTVFPNGTVYAATKHAIHAIAEGLRKEVHSRGVRVGVISPGFTANEIWGYTDPAESRKEAEAGEALLSEDIAEVVVHTLSLPAHVNIADVLVLPSRRDVPAI